MELKIIPRMSEKTVGLAETKTTYTFDVPKTANKQQVAAAVSAQYGVTVVSVNIAIAKGKVKQSYRKGGRPVMARRTDVKKAYVRLAEGQEIAAFKPKAEEEKK